LARNATKPSSLSAVAALTGQASASSSPPPQAEVFIGRQGRWVIPTALRRALGVSEGDTLVARLDGERLVLEKRATVLERVKRVVT
jgi:hypothetical protein